LLGARGEGIAWQAVRTMEARRGALASQSPTPKARASSDR